jgi:hypothetical protein
VTSDERPEALRASLPAIDLARVLGNALAFIPAASRVKYGLIAFSEGVVYTCGTDSYAAGTDYAAAEIEWYAAGIEEPYGVLVDKAGLTALDRAAREAKKAEVDITVEGLDVVLYLDEKTEPVRVPHYEDDTTRDLHDSVAEMIATATVRPPTTTGVLCVDPQLVSRFGKVKTDKTARRADLYMTEEYGAVLVKIGPTFKGLFMPVERETHAANVGSDGLW